MYADRAERRAAITSDDLHSKFSTESLEENGKEDPAATTTTFGSLYLSTLKDPREYGLAHRNESVKTLQTVDSTNRTSDDSEVVETDNATEQTIDSPAPKKTKQKRSVLILGVSGKTGSECVRRFAESQESPLLFGLCREMKRMGEETMLLCRKHCEELIEGDATRAVDLYRALQISQADTVLVCLGSDPKSKKKQSTIRTESAVSLVKVLVHPPFHHVRVIVISSLGAGDSSQASSLACIVPQGGASAACLVPSLGKNRKYDILDHQGQEEVFSMNQTIRARTTLVRPTPFVEEGKTRRIATFKSHHKPPSARTVRKDLAKWLVTESSYHSHEGKAVNVTSV